MAHRGRVMRHGPHAEKRAADPDWLLETAFPQISSGLRRSVRRVESAPRGLSARWGNGGTKSREAFAAGAMKNRLSRERVSSADLTPELGSRDRTGRRLLLDPPAQNAVR